MSEQRKKCNIRTRKARY